MAIQKNLMLEQPTIKGIALKAVGRINLIKKTTWIIHLLKKEDGRICLLKKRISLNKKEDYKIRRIQKEELNN